MPRRGTKQSPPGGTVAPGSYGNSSNVPVVTVDQFGRIIGISTTGVGGGGGGNDLTAPPVFSNWTWVNQGGASAADSTAIYVGASQVDGIKIEAPTSAGDNLRILKKAAPSAPYTITMAFLANFQNANYYAVGFCWRQSSDGKLIVASVGRSTTFKFSVDKWTSPTVYSANYAACDLSFLLIPIWLKLQDDNTNRIVSYSTDGVTWIQIHSVGRTDFLTADEVGFYANVNNASFGASGALVHWVQS